jgi:salicylate hydroxylase
MMPNAMRVLKEWGFGPERSSMVPVRKASLINGSTMKVLSPNWTKDSEATWGFPMLAVHREDLHSQLRTLATQQDGEGRPCEIRAKSKVVDYVRERDPF